MRSERVRAKERMTEVSGPASEPRWRRKSASPLKFPSDEAATFDYWDVAPTLGADKFVTVEDGWDGKKNCFRAMATRCAPQFCSPAKREAP